MPKTDCDYEKISNVSVGGILLLIGLGFLVISFTILPIIGLVITIPVLILAAIFMLAPKSDTCQLVADRSRKMFSR